MVWMCSHPSLQSIGHGQWLSSVLIDVGIEWGRVGNENTLICSRIFIVQGINNEIM